MVAGDLLIWVSGAQPKLLRERCPTDRAKYLGIGGAILLTAGVAATSMTFALTTALKAPLIVGLAFALLWGLAIMSLDRWLVVSLQREQGLGWFARYAPMALIRLLLALLIGFIVSTPFVLEIFHPEIDNEIAIIHAQKSDEFQRHPPLQGAITNDQAEVAQFEKLVKTGGAAPKPFQNPTVASLVSQRNKAQTQVKYWYGVYNCQLYGKPFENLTCEAGNGPAAQKALNRYRGYQTQVGTLTTKINNLVDGIESQYKNGSKQTIAKAQASLDSWQKKLSKDQQTQRGLIKQFNTTNSANGGLLIRLQALSDLTDRNTTLTWARWLLFALFTTIECLPVLVKTLLNLGKPTAYELVHAQQEDMWVKVSKHTTRKKEMASRIESDSIVAEADQLAEDRGAIIGSITRRAADAELNVAMAWIDQWERQQQAEVGRGNIPTGAGPRFSASPAARAAWQDSAGNGSQAGAGWGPVPPGRRGGNGRGRRGGNGRVRQAGQWPGRPSGNGTGGYAAPGEYAAQSGYLGDPRNDEGLAGEANGVGRRPAPPRREDLWARNTQETQDAYPPGADSPDLAEDYGGPEYVPFDNRETQPRFGRFGAVSAPLPGAHDYPANGFPPNGAPANGTPANGTPPNDRSPVRDAEPYPPYPADEGPPPQELPMDGE